MQETKEDKYQIVACSSISLTCENQDLSEDQTFFYPEPKKWSTWKVVCNSWKKPAKREWPQPTEQRLGIEDRESIQVDNLLNMWSEKMKPLLSNRSVTESFGHTGRSSNRLDTAICDSHWSESWGIYSSQFVLLGICKIVKYDSAQLWRNSVEFSAFIISMPWIRKSLTFLYFSIFRAKNAEKINSKRTLSVHKENFDVYKTTVS